MLLPTAQGGTASNRTLYVLYGIIGVLVIMALVLERFGVYAIILAVLLGARLAYRWRRTHDRTAHAR